MSRSNPQQNAPNPAVLWNGETIQSFLGYDPTGICACGCGQKTNVSPRNVRTKNRFKGIPAEFCKGHYKRMQQTKWYKLRNMDGRMRTVHRIRAEAALGKPLPAGAVVHHADGTKSATSALVICQDTAYHSLLHRRMRVKMAGGNPNTDRICDKCRAVKDIDLFYRNRSACDGRARICKACDNKRRAGR